MKKYVFYVAKTVYIFAAIILMTDARILKRIADQKVSIVKPGTSFETSSTRMALIIIVKSPKVRIVIGSVRRIKNGLRRTLKTLSINATKSAVVKLATCTPGRIYEAMVTISALASQL